MLVRHFTDRKYTKPLSANENYNWECLRAGQATLIHGHVRSEMISAGAFIIELLFSIQCLLLTGCKLILQIKCVYPAHTYARDLCCKVRMGRGPGTNYPCFPFQSASVVESYQLHQSNLVLLFLICARFLGRMFDTRRWLYRHPPLPEPIISAFRCFMLIFALCAILLTLELHIWNRSISSVRCGINDKTLETSSLVNAPTVTATVHVSQIWRLYQAISCPFWIVFLSLSLRTQKLQHVFDALMCTDAGRLGQQPDNKCCRLNANNHCIRLQHHNGQCNT
jgi:hypothetical protein